MKFKQLILFTGLLLGLFMLSGTTVMAADYPEDTYVITTEDQFNTFAQAVNASTDLTSNKVNSFTISTFTYTNAVLTADLTFSSSTFITTVGNGYHQFSGTFSGEDADGNKHTITIESSANCTQSLFYAIVDGGTIENLTVAGTIGDASSTTIGGIASINSGTIQNCTVTATVTGSKDIGGIAGVNNNTISDCTVSASFSSTGDCVGGIAGVNYYTISDCTVSNSVSGSIRVGGITGYNEKTISGCTVSNSVSGNQYIGGITGVNMLTISDCTMSDSASVSGNQYIGGVAGSNTGTIGGDTADDGCTVSGSVKGITSYNASADADTTDSVGGIAGLNNGGSILNCDVTATVTGSRDSSATSIGCYIADFGGVAGENSGGTISGCTVSGDISIDPSNIPDTVTDLLIEDFGGIAGYNHEGSISACAVSGDVSGTNAVGGIVGYNTTNNGTGADISNCQVTSNVSAKNQYAGGITGQNEFGSISACTVSGAISYTDIYGSIDFSSGDSPDGFGGIAGYNGGGNISDCTVSLASGNTIAATSDVGGIAGYNQFYDSTPATISECSFSGSITGTGTSDCVGGIAGYNSESTISNCASQATLAGTSDVGGIVGQDESTTSSTIKNAYFNGTITASTNVGGIIGSLASSAVTIQNTYYPINTGISGVGSDSAVTDGISAIADFTTGSVAWGLQNPDKQTPAGDTQTGLVWGQTLVATDSFSVDDAPVLISDSSAQASKQVQQLLFYNSAEDKTNNTIAYTRYANEGGTTVNYPDPADGTYWQDESGNPFTDTTIVNGSQTLVQTTLMTMDISVSAAITTSTGSTPSFANYGFTGTFPDSYVITYSTDNTNFSTTLPTFSTAGTYTVYFNITAPAYADKTDLSTTVTVKSTSSPGGGGGSSTPAMTGITVKPVIISPGQILTAADFDMTGQPDGATVYYSTDGITYTTTPPSFEETGTYTVYIKITASGYQDYTTTTTVTVTADDDNDNGRSVTLFPLDDTSSQPSALPGGGFGIAYSYDLAAYLSGSATTSAASNTDSADDSLSVASATAYSITSIDDPYGLLADGQDAPTIDEQGLFSCFLNYAAASPTGQTAAKTSGDSETLTETTATASTQSTNNLASMNAADDSTSDTNIDSSDTVMLTAAVVINVTLNSGDITPITLDIEVPQRIYNIDYRTHIQNLGWEENFVENGNLSGTQGQSLRLEAIEIQMDTDYDLGVSYRTHVQNIGWEENYVSDGAESGTDGQGLRLEAIELSLTGADADYFDIYYQVHVQNLGWLDWASNGHPAGSAGFGYRLEGIRIVVVPKGADAPGATANCFVEQ